MFIKRLIQAATALLLFTSVALADRNILLNESTAAERGVQVYLVDATDNETEETGLTITGSECVVCQNGASCANCAGTWVEAGNGVYEYRLDTTEVDTLGSVTVRVADAAANKFVATANIVAPDPTTAGVTVQAAGIPYNAYGSRGTAQSATGTTLRLAAAEGFADDELNDDNAVVIVSATTGGGQVRCIRDYASATDTATVDTWITTPTGTITYDVIAAPGCTLRAADIATAAITAAKFAAGAITATVAPNLDAAVSSVASSGSSVGSGTFQTSTGPATVKLAAADSKNYRKGQVLCGSSGNVSGQCSMIVYYNSTTKVASVFPAFSTTPVNTETYAVYPSNYGLLAPKSW